MLQKLPNKIRNNNKDDDINLLFCELSSVIQKEKNELYFLEEMSKGDMDSFLNTFFGGKGSETNRTQFFETAPLIWFLIGGEASSFEDLYKKSEDENILNHPEWGNSQHSAMSIMKKLNKSKNYKDKNDFFEAVKFLSDSAYQGLPYDRVVDFIWSSINDYYNAFDKGLTDQGSKQNTADAILIFEGDHKSIIDSIKKIKNISQLNTIISNAEKNDGVITIDKNVFIQASMKKSADDARIGKILTKMQSALGLKNSALVGFQKNDCTSDNPYLRILEEGIWEDIKSFASKLKGNLSNLYNKIINIWKNFIGIFFNKVNKVGDDIIKENNEILANELGLDYSDITSILKEDYDIIVEEKLGELRVTKDAVLTAINRIKKDSTKYKTEILNKEKVLSDLGIFVSYLKLFYIEKNPEKLANNLIKKPSRDTFRPIAKQNANVSALQIVMFILEEILNNEKIKDIPKSLAKLVSVASKESIYGNTLLPLWKLFGGDKGLVYLGTKTKDIDLNWKEITVPIMIFEGKPESKGKPWNITTIYMLDLEDLTMDDDQKYFIVELQTESTSKFSFKIEINSKMPYGKLKNKL